MKLVKDAKKAYKFWSVQASALAVFLVTIAPEVLEFIVMMEPALGHWRGVLPDWAHSAMVTATIAASVILRLLDQGDDDVQPPEEPVGKDTGRTSGRTVSTAVRDEPKA